MKILLTDCATLSLNGDLCLDRFGDFGQAVYHQNIDRKTLLCEVCDTDIILCNKTVIDAEVMNAAPKLKYIGLFATGYNNIDIKTAKQRGITVCNAGSYSTDAVAQQVFAYILAHYCQVEKYNNAVMDGRWCVSPTFSMLYFPTDEIAGKTLGIIGYGSIGRAVEKIARAFNMKILVHTRTVRDNGVTEFVSLDELLSRSDIVTVHCPLNDQSREMFDGTAFSKMRDGAFFINTSRGGTVNESALRAALQNGKLSGAAVDVLQKEPMADDCPLLGAPNLIITPHTAWAPLTTRERLLGIVYDNINGFLNGNPQNVIV